MIKLIIEKQFKDKFFKEIEYVFYVIQSILGIKIDIVESVNEIYKGDIVIQYGTEFINITKSLNIVSSYMFSEKYMKKESMPKDKLYRYNNIPIIYGTYKYNEGAYVNYGKTNIITNIDIVQSIFFMLTRYEEIILWNDVKKDRYNRFPAEESLAYKEKFLNIPIVNEYIEWFWNWIIRIGYNGQRRNILKGYDFIACLTHDVDIPFKYINKLGDTLKELKKSSETINKLMNVVQHTISKINYKKDPYYTFNYIRECEKKYKFTASFYFMNGGNSIYENFYNIDDERILKLIKDIEEDNCEVGYHYSFNSYNDLAMRINEKQGLDYVILNKPYGGRNHYLRFDPIESLKICEKVGMLYDTTLSYADYDGFRCGICIPYKPFDLKERRILDIWEIPLIVMEGTLMDNQYRNLNCEEAFLEIKNKIDTVKRYNGVFTLLWHNSSLDNTMICWKEVFKKTIKYLYDNNAAGMSGRELINIINQEN